ncbi:MAG: sugar ABC transporter permease [Meiothermus sp.]
MKTSRGPWAVVSRILFYLLVVFIVVYSVFPFYWAVISSFKTSDSLFSANPSFLPIPFTLAHYQNVFSGAAFGRNLFNSLLVAGGATLISLVLGVSAAYALGRLRFPPKNIVLYIVLAMTMFPQVSVLSGMFVLLRQLNLFNSFPGLIFSYLLFTLPFTIWVLTGYFRGLPRELEEAAYVDGATPIQTLLRVMLPITGPGLITTGLLAFISAWNEYLFALTFTIGNSVKTVPVAIASFGGASPFEVPWGSIMAASVIVTVPLVILVLIFQQRIVAGLTAGAVKG